MGTTITKRPQATCDLLELADYIARDSLEAAERFLKAAEEAFQLLAGMPELGVHCPFRSRRAKGIRVWAIRGFEDYLVFYRPIKAGIDVVRVLHGARDIPSLFTDNGN